MMSWLDLLPRLPTDEPLTEEQVIQVANYWVFGDNIPFLHRGFGPSTPIADNIATPHPAQSQNIPVGTIFPDDIEMYRPDIAEATVYLVDPATMEIQIFTPARLWFFNDNGQWKIDQAL
jgi:hypothetical protein